jgi:hypothetical protein
MAMPHAVAHLSASSHSRDVNDTSPMRLTAAAILLLAYSVLLV